MSQFLKAFFQLKWRTVFSVFGKGGVLACKNNMLKNYYPSAAEVAKNINLPVLNYIKENKKDYQKIILLSATPQFFLERVSALNESFDIFDEIHGSTIINLKGLEKLKFIQQYGWQPFVYMGDAKADEVLFKASAGHYVKITGGYIEEVKHN